MRPLSDKCALVIQGLLNDGCVKIYSNLRMCTTSPCWVVNCFEHNRQVNSFPIVDELSAGGVLESDAFITEL